MHLIQDVDKSSVLLELKQLQIRHQQHILVDDVNFKLYAGQSLAIVGESGSGKSLTSLALLGLLPHSLQLSGLALFEQQNLLKLHPLQQQKIRGARIAMIFQEPMSALNPLHRVEKLIGECLYLQGWSKARVRAHVIQLLTDVGMTAPEQKLSCYPHQLSGGQRQRVMIAMALALEPDILIADEPTTALDVTLQGQILNLLQRLQQQRNMALILISHDLNLVRRYADEVVVMHQGKVLEQGPVERVFNQPQHAYTQHLLDHDFGQANIRPITDIPLLQLQQLGVRFPIRGGWFNRIHDYFTALEPLSLTLRQGESIAIVGESGSGKSSLALAIARLIESEGEIYLQNCDINKLAEKDLRPLRVDFQIVFQDPWSSLNPRLTVAQIIAEGLALQSYSKADQQQQIDNVLQQVELSSTLKSRYPHELSGGQRQRIALARALVLKPKLLILDEPTSALDRTTQRSIVQLLRRLQAELGLSYLFISHDLHVVKALCHQILVLRHAKLVEFQPTELLFTQAQTEYTRQLIQASQYK